MSWTLRMLDQVHFLLMNLEDWNPPPREKPLMDVLARLNSIRCYLIRRYERYAEEA